jgi:acyl-coenzyme A thioesterase 13
MDAPAGFQPLFRTSPVLDLIGPLYSHGKGADLVIGMRVEAKHCNARGSIHGGILATLADVAIGYAMSTSTEPPTSAITTNLSLDYAGTAKVGDWVESRPDIHKVGTRLAFGNCYLCVGDERIVRASAVFLVTGPG